MHRPLILASVVAVASLAGTIALWRARHVAPYRPRLERINLQVPAGHEGLAGLTIGFVTDTHISPAYRPLHLRHAVSRLAAARPDLLLFGGDYASETTRFAYEAAPILGALAAAAPLGGYAVLGNHDEQLGAEKVAGSLTSAGITVLRNDACPICYGGDTLWLVGLDDALAAKHALAKAFVNVPQPAASLALWHEADWAEEAASYGAFAQLSGHTHGGQIRLPFAGALVLPPGGRRFDAGFSDIMGMRLYISRGVGVYRPAVRFRCPPELTLITLSA